MNEELPTAQEVKELLKRVIRRALAHLLPQGIFTKNKFYVGDVRGNKGKSLVVEVTGPKAGLWIDFATGESGDILDLWSAVCGIDIERDFPGVIASVQKWLGVAPTQLNKITESVCAPSACSLGKPAYKWDYYDVNGNILISVYRYDTPKGKEFRPYDVKTGKYQAPEFRPLYNLPGIIGAQTIVIVEGEKAAQALIDIGVCATTAMGGANAPIDKTDWSPLFGKDLLIWPDNDEPGKKYAKALINKLKAEIIYSLAVIMIPKNKPAKWDAADAVLEKDDVSSLLKNKIMIVPKLYSTHSLKHLVHDTTPVPSDIIAPRILVPKGLLVIAGAPKVGKSDFLMALLSQLAGGKPFLGMTPPRPLKIVYLQTEIGYPYLQERTQSMKLSDEFLSEAGDNLFIASEDPIKLDEAGVEIARRTILYRFPNRDVDIIALDPLRHVFDRGKDNQSENDNGAMLDFLQKRLEVLRDLVNPRAGTILIHHTRKISTQQLEEEEFQALAGAGSLHGHFSSGILIYKPDPTKSTRKLIFELRHGKPIPPKHVDKNDDKWEELQSSEQLVGKDYSQKLDAERRRKHHVILQIIYNQAQRGHAYTINQFCEKFEGKAGLGSKDTIRDRLDILANTGHIKFFRNAEDYGLTSPARTKYGYLCVEGMKLVTKDSELGTVKTQDVYPSHFKHDEGGALLPVENPKIWIYYDNKGDKTCEI